MKQFLEKLSSYIEFSTFERRGVFSLLFILLIISGYYYFKNSRSNEVINVDDEKLTQLRENMKLALAKRTESRYPKSPYNEHQNKERENIISEFDPNNDDFDVLLSKGLPYSVAKNMVNYREKVGRFNEVRDLNKLYSIDKNFYLKIKNFVKIDSISSIVTQSKVSVDSRDSNKAVKIRVELNTANAEELQSVSGVGPAYARWIIDYRKKLGGFISKDQLLEVYRLDKQKLDEIEEFLVIEPESIHRIDINVASFKELMKHPYINYNQAKSLIAYREQHGRFVSKNDIRELYLFKSEETHRLLPYLDVN